MNGIKFDKSSYRWSPLWLHHKIGEKNTPIVEVECNQILSYNSLGLSVCLFEPVHSDPLTVSARLILQPPDDRNEVSKWAAPGLKCSSARCGSWWWRDTRLLDPLSPRTSHRSRRHELTEFSETPYHNAGTEAYRSNCKSFWNPKPKYYSDHVQVQCLSTLWCCKPLLKLVPMKIILLSTLVRFCKTHTGMTSTVASSNFYNRLIICYVFHYSATHISTLWLCNSAVDTMHVCKDMASKCTYAGDTCKLGTKRNHHFRYITKLEKKTPIVKVECSQIWLNHLMDDCHFSYITKLKKKTSLDWSRM